VEIRRNDRLGRPMDAVVDQCGSDRRPSISLGVTSQGWVLEVELHGSGNEIGEEDLAQRLAICEVKMGFPKKDMDIV
jgi:hypothetical protein